MHLFGSPPELGALSSCSLAHTDLIDRLPKAFAHDLLDHSISLVEQKFRVSTKSDDWALAGLSIEGAQTVNIGFNHVNLCHSIGVFSTGIGANVDPVKLYPVCSLASAATNKKMKIIWICVGDKDFALGGSQALSKTLTDHNIKHSFSTTPGYTDGRSGGIR